MKQKNESSRNLQVALIGLATVVVIVFIIGWYVYEPVPVTIQGSAEVNEVRVSGKVPGRILHLYAEEGQQVNVGDTLVLIDSPEVRAKLAQANAAKAAAMAQQQKAHKGVRSETIEGAYEMWQKAEIGVDIAKKSYDRVERLFEKGVITAQNRDEVEAQYNAAVATAAAAKSQYSMAKNGAEEEDKLSTIALVDKAKGAIAEVEAFLAETVLISPISGEVSEVFPASGELVATGSPIMNIVDMNDIWFSFNVREDLLGEMKMGNLIAVTIPALDEKATLEITYVKALASYATWKATKATGQFDVKTFEVRATPTASIKDLRPGMSAIMERVIK
ncbi:MAG: efflux RND transporter periplasmic adaptor subunit [Dysgonamonadaceae bacterium]|nr:efflux RND transporter periplasmic adaptor subunit [Dysgonamonadaceae bacterium]MDD4727484.1 efflux RND transporter periplasmic adaptor subunit [Dysgonamonadaceae bacterium]